MYFNYTIHTAESRWERHTFIRGWWRLYADDKRWTPPYYPALRRALQSRSDPHLTRVSPAAHHVEALRGRRPHGSTGGTFNAAIMEETVAATVLLHDPRRQDGTAYLGLLRFANDTESLERLLSGVMEHLWRRGVRRVIGPTGLSPHLQSGVLQNYFHQLSPLHAPYNPPYLPEIMNGLMRPLMVSRLYRVTVPPQSQARQRDWRTITSGQRGPAQLSPLAPRQLAHSLLRLLCAACDGQGPWPAPDSQEAFFLLRQLEPWPLYGWLACVNRNPAGFALLQPDLTASIRLAKGGRNPLWRLWLAWRAHRPTSSGRLLFGAVLPEQRRQGIGSQLWERALHTAQQLEWRTLTVGPVPVGADAVGFLEKRGAQAQQEYVVYELEI